MTLRERLAELEHEQWMAWAKSLMRTEKIDPDRRFRWESLFIPYEDLSEAQKDLDREWADKVLAIVAEGI